MDPVVQDEPAHPQEVAIPDTQPPVTLTQQQTDQASPPIRQTRSGRVKRNTPRYEQSVNQRNQGLVAWEILLDQDDREDVPTAASHYAIQKAQDNPMAFAAMGNPDILYWDQAMKAHDRDKFIEAVGAELEGHERMGNYEPIPLDQVPMGTNSSTWCGPCDASAESIPKKCTNGKPDLMCMADSKYTAFTTGILTHQ